MPEHIRALVVILVLAAIVFTFCFGLATATAVAKDDFSRRRKYWFLVTLVGFLSPNLLIFIVLVSITLYFAAKHEKNRVALYLFLLLALPQIRGEIPGIAGIRYLLEVDYVKILTLVVLLPACTVARREAVKNKSRATLADKILACYVVFIEILRFHNDSFTGFLRSIPTIAIDVLIPYYAISRSLKDIKSIRDALMSFTVAAMIASSVGVFEFIKHWLLYSTFASTWGLGVSGRYLLRADYLRAVATSGQTIVFGYVIAVSIGFYLFIKNSVQSKLPWLIGGALLIAGEIVSLSKGPWIGVVAMLVLFAALSPNRLKYAAKFIGIMISLMVVIYASGSTAKIMGFLPFVGTVDEGSFTYRQKLFDMALNIILQNPFFGSTDYRSELEELRQGEGIIDIVNTFIGVALNYGLVGLILFILFFGIILVEVFKSRNDVINFSEFPEFLDLGNAIFSVLIGIIIIIFTVSPIYHIPVIWWAISALGVAYITLVRKLNGKNVNRPRR